MYRENRRKLIAGIGVGMGAGLMLGMSGAAQAARLLATPRQTAGPFYPAEPPLDDDNDLVTVAGQPRMARGVITRVRGRVLDGNGMPVTGARVEIWQCDANGRYHHQRDSRDVALDAGFQGFGHATTDAGGEYLFRTIRPVAYPGRTPHIHYRVVAPGASALTTQMYVAGEARNADDFLYQRLDPAERERVTVALRPAALGTDAELSGVFDIVLS